VNLTPEYDGIDHINVYSKGKTQLGRLLSNFADTPFQLPVKGWFACVEGFWYWTITGDEQLRYTSGWQSKKIGESLPKLREHPTEMELLEAYEAKLDANSTIERLLNQTDLPLTHYYVYGGKVVEPKEWQWTALLWNNFRNLDIDRRE
jgi:hypothetical protein